MLNGLLDAETGQRGYMITGADAYLKPYTDAAAIVDATYRELRKLTDDNPNQQHRLDDLKIQIDGKLAELAHTVELRKTSADAAYAIVNNNTGKQFMDNARKILADMDGVEANLLEVRAKEADASTTLTTAIIL